MIDESVVEIAEYTKKKVLQKKPSDAIITVSRSDASETKFVNNEIVKTAVKSDSDITIFAVWDKKIAVTQVKEFKKDKIDKVVEKLHKFGRQIMPKDDYFGIADGPFKYKKIPDTFDKKIVGLSAGEHLDYIDSGINAALEQGASRASGIFVTGHSDAYLTSSRGVVAQNEKSSAYFSIRALIDAESSGHNTAVGCMLKDLDIPRTGAAAGEIARLSHKPIPGEGGQYDVIFAPLAFAPLLSVAGSAASIFAVESGLSFFKNRLGKKVASSNVNLLDHGPLPGGFGSLLFDEEGVPTQKNTLINKGIFKTFLYNTSFARKYKTKSTGNAGLIDPTNWHIVLEPGKLTKENLFSQVKNGIYVSNIWYTRFQNYLAGNFSTIPRDGMFLIKNGEFHKPIKQLRIADNILKILQNISAIANDSRQVYSWEIGEAGAPVTLPHILVKKVNFTEPTG